MPQAGEGPAPSRTGKTVLAILCSPKPPTACELGRSRLRRFVRAAVAGLSLLLPVISPAAVQQPAMAQDRSAAPRPVDPRLAKGVSLSHWFANSFNGYEEGHLSSFITDS